MSDLANTQTVLVVDDDKETVRLVRAYLEKSGYRIFTASDGETALHHLRREAPHLLILDLMLPDRDGWDITRIIRSDPVLRQTPIIMLTARAEDSDKIVGLELGADDYITKPFNPRELVARVRSVLRRVNDQDDEDSKILRYRSLQLDPSARKVKLADDFIDITPLEFEILSILLARPGHVFTRREIIERGLNYNYGGLERSLDTHIKNLRKKMGDDSKEPEYIQTVYGVGYRLGVRD